MPKISVIIPVYNTEEYLKECLDSIIEQTLKNLEIIIVNDGSTDNSKEICEEYASKDNRIKIIYQKNQGAAIARNKGIAMAKGEYLYFLDSDDYIAADMLEKMLNKIEQEQADICICKYYDVNANKKISLSEISLRTQLIPKKNTFNVYDVPQNIFQICSIPTWNKLYKKSFIDKYALKYQNLSSCNDHFFNDISLVLASSITYLTEPLFFHRLDNKNSITSKRYLYAENVFKAGEEIKKYLKNINKFELVEISFYKIVLISFIYEYNLLKSPKKRLKLLILAIRFFLKKYLLYFLIFYIKQKIIYFIYIILLKLGIKDRVKKLLEKLGYKFDE